MSNNDEDFQYLGELKKMCRMVETAYRSSFKQIWHTGIVLVSGMVLSGPVYSMEVKRLGHYEKTVARKFAQSVFISSEETQLFRRRVTDRPVAVIPHGVDLDFFHRNGTAYIEDSHKADDCFCSCDGLFPQHR